MQRIFSEESTYNLIKKFVVYKMMGSDMFINHSLRLVNSCYSVLGISTTNTVVNNSFGQLFISGETVNSLMADVYDLEKRNINSLAGYAVEGMAIMEDDKILEIYQKTLESIEAQTEGGREGNFAIKFSGFISMDILTRLSTS